MGLPRWKLVLLVLIYALTAMVSLELSVRWLVPAWRSDVAYSARSIRLQEIAPNLDRTLYRRGVVPGRADSTRIRTDFDGLILPNNVDGGRPVDLTIAFLGGSTTESLWVREDLRWPYLVGKSLSRQFGLNIRVLNAGAGGANLHHTIDLFLNKVIKHTPDIVIVMHAINDCGVLMSRGVYDDWMIQNLWQPGGPVRRYYRLLASYSAGWRLLRHVYVTAAADRQHESGVTPADFRPVGLLLREFDLRLRLMASAIRAAGAVPVLLTEPFRDRKALANVDFRPEDRFPSELHCTAFFNDRVREFARREGVDLVDLERHMYGSEHFFDFAHFTDEGSIIAADGVAASLRPVVNRAVRRGRS